jgi:hypothetical protein
MINVIYLWISEIIVTLKYNIDFRKTVISFDQLNEQNEGKIIHFNSKINVKSTHCYKTSDRLQ